VTRQLTAVIRAGHLCQSSSGITAVTASGAITVSGAVTVSVVSTTFTVSVASAALQNAVRQMILTR